MHALVLEVPERKVNLGSMRHLNFHDCPSRQFPVQRVWSGDLDATEPISAATLSATTWPNKPILFQIPYRLVP
jgi:hypothetical protein